MALAADRHFAYEPEVARRRSRRTPSGATGARAPARGAAGTAEPSCPARTEIDRADRDGVGAGRHRPPDEHDRAVAARCAPELPYAARPRGRRVRRAWQRSEEPAVSWRRYAPCGGRRGPAARGGRRTPGGRRRRPSPGRAARSSVASYVVGRLRRPGGPARRRGGSRSVSGIARAARAPRRALAPLDEQLGEADDGVLVAGLELERLARRLPRRRRRAASAERLAPRSGSRPLDELAHRRLGLGADEAVDDLAVLAARTRPGWTAPGTPGEICGFSSTLTLTSTTLPSVSSTTFSRIGPSVRHGPHHGAHRSTTTGTVLGALEDLGLEGGIGDVDSSHGAQRYRRPRRPADGRPGRRRRRGTVRAMAPRRDPHADVEGVDVDRRVTRRGSRRNVAGADAPLRLRRSSPAATPTSPSASPTPTARAACCAGRRSATCSPPPTTWAASTASSPRSARPTCRSRRRSACAPTTAVNGAPFYVMGFVDGTSSATAPTAERVLDRRGAGRRRRVDRRHAGRASTPSTSTPSGSATSAATRATSPAS